MNRKQRRAAKKQKSSEAIETKMALFGKLPDSCVACGKPFDKKDKDMAMTWSVAVREKEEIVDLFCPSCWSKHG